MSLSSVGSLAVERKVLAMLSLPLLTNNGTIRSVNTPLGNALVHLCGFNYKQAMLTKFMAELKYLGASEHLLRRQVEFWHKFWREHPVGEMELPILCYYVDGNTKALWSKKHVKKNKVTMLGRVMGCVEMLFIHDSFGRPIYFETYPGHAPMGEYVLSLFKKIGPLNPEMVNIDTLELERLYQAIKVRQLSAVRFRGGRPDKGPPRLAVLPLAGVSDEEEWFSAGMTDAIITALSGISGLQVIARTSAYHYIGTSKSMRQIASELGVGYIVEGTVMRSGQEVRVSAQLINAPEDQHLWARNFVWEFRYIMALQGEIARAITEQIDVHLTSQE